MKHIPKKPNAPIVREYQEQLANAGLDKSSLLSRKKTESLKGAKLYKGIKKIQSWEKLKEFLYKEQGGVCCYCGKQIGSGQGEVRGVAVEHVFPKSVYPELVGEYLNLLLCCDGQVQPDNNSSQSNKTRLHCDQAKGNKELNYTPLESDCATHFKYTIDGKVEWNDNKATKDIETLNLNDESLVSRRKTCIDSFIFNGSGHFLDNEQLQKLCNQISTRDNQDRHSEFYFVIEDCINRLLRQL